MAPAISVQQLSVTFRGRRRQEPVQALRGIEFELAPGRIVGILGPNGSGKTTLLRVLAGLQAPTAGRAEVLGMPTDAPPLLRRLAYQPEGPLPLGVLSAAELLAYTGARLGIGNAESDRRATSWLARLDLAHAGRRPVRTFSTGMQKRLALACALLGDPEVLLLDEPTSGLDPFGSEAVLAVLRERRAAGTTVLMASHHLLEVEELCDEVIVMQDGELRARGSLGELLAGGDHALTVRGLDAAAIGRLGAFAQELGGDVVRSEPAREHLFALFRRLARGTGARGR